MQRTLLQAFLYIFVVTAVFAPIAGWLKTSTTFVLKAENVTPYPEPEAKVEYERDQLEEYVEEIDSEDEAMKAIVKEVFGEHYDKAMLLLTCENRGLNPEAIGDNSKFGNNTKDWGLFQINDYWQGFRHEGKAMQYLLDPEINARVAWRLYEDDGYSFKLWSCGKKLGI